MTRAPVWVAAVALALALVPVTLGCAGTRAWERETLAQEKMQFGSDPDAETVEQHLYQYREASAGGYGGNGGGCGCN